MAAVRPTRPSSVSVTPTRVSAPVLCCAIVVFIMLSGCRLGGRTLQFAVCSRAGNDFPDTSQRRQAFVPVPRPVSLFFSGRGLVWHRT